MQNRLSNTWQRLKAPDRGPELAELRARVVQLERDVEESRRLNERLSDVLDVVTELLVPAVERDEEKLSRTLEKLRP